MWLHESLKAEEEVRGIWNLRRTQHTTVGFEDKERATSQGMQWLLEAENHLQLCQPVRTWGPQPCNDNLGGGGEGEVAPPLPFIHLCFFPPNRSIDQSIYLSVYLSITLLG